MKALVSAFALLAFLAAGFVPATANAATVHHRHHHRHVHHAAAHRHHVAHHHKAV